LTVSAPIRVRRPARRVAAGVPLEAIRCLKRFIARRIRLDPSTQKKLRNLKLPLDKQKGVQGWHYKMHGYVANHGAAMSRQN
jgi:hypothetical protein